MRLTVLGSNATYPTPGRPASGYLLQHGGTSVWIDVGHGTFAALQTLIDYRLVDAVVVSHVHADHCADLFAYYHALKYGTEPRQGIPAYVPEGLVDRVAGFLGDPNHSIRQTFDFRVSGDASEVQIGGLAFSFSLTDHPVPTLGVRAVADGRTLAYSADTGPAGGWPELAREADLFLCEATYQGEAAQKPWSHHLTAGEAGAIARQQGARRLMLTHIWPALDPARSVQEAEAGFGRPVRLAVPGMIVDV